MEIESMYIVARKRGRRNLGTSPKAEAGAFPVLGSRYPARAPIQAILGAKKK
jgi:hypothetical protein